MSYPYLIAAALQEELHEFIQLTRQHSTPVSGGQGLEEIEIPVGGKTTKISLFTSNVMGMPYNAAKLSEIIDLYTPKYTLFIGTCAGLKSQQIGSVVIPRRAFSYESGKYESGLFHSDFQAYDFSESLRTQAEAFYNLNKDQLNYKATTDEDICSGAAVIDDEEKAKEIANKGGRKLSALDMEAYSMACLNHLRKPHHEFLVIKSVSDLAFNKQQCEGLNGKELAKKNAAKFTLGLLEYLIKKGIPDTGATEPIQLSFFQGIHKEGYYKLKVMIRITNVGRYPIALYSQSFAFSSHAKLDPVAINTPHIKPLFLAKKSFVPAQNKEIDIYEDLVIVKPSSKVESCWLPVDPDLQDILPDLLTKKGIGIWHWSWFEMGGTCRKEQVKMLL